MRKSPISLSLLSALASIGLSASAAAGAVVERAAPVRRSRRTAATRIYRRSKGRPYPEQSTRQALRGQRRAQGGPGLTFTGTGYEPRT